MLGELPPRGHRKKFKGMLRRLTKAEIDFLRRLFSWCRDGEKFSIGLEDIFVQDMDDGGMGGVFFLSKNRNDQVLGNMLMELEFFDEDGAIVSVVINLDQNGDLYEMDVFKGDFSALLSFPEKEDIIIKYRS